MRVSKTLSAMLLVTTLTLAAGVLAAPARHLSRKAARRDSVLAAEAKISLTAAQATALAKVPGGKIRSSELEREHGKLIYSFDIKVAGKSGIEEVNIDAIDGHVIGVVHEGVKAEKIEAKQDKAEARRDSVKSK